MICAITNCQDVSTVFIALFRSSYSYLARSTVFLQLWLKTPRTSFIGKMQLKHTRKSLHQVSWHILAPLNSYQDGHLSTKKVSVLRKLLSNLNANILLGWVQIFILHSSHQSIQPSRSITFKERFVHFVKSCVRLGTYHICQGAISLHI